MNSQSRTYIVTTRPLSESEDFIKRIKQLGFSVLSSPGIKISKNTLTATAKKHLEMLSTFDWILFTSGNGVRFFMETLKDLHIDPAILANKSIGVVGPKTAAEASHYNLPIHSIPSQFTNRYIAREIEDITKKKILLPRSNIASPLLVTDLRNKGAVVVSLPIYKTEYSTKQNKKFEKLLEKDQIAYLTFTSPSTIKGFMQNLRNEESKKKVVVLPVISIGPVTTKTAKKYGFKEILTAKVYTTDGMITKLQESIL